MNNEKKTKKKLEQMVADDSRLTISGSVDAETYELMKRVAATSSSVRIIHEIVIEQPGLLVDKMESYVEKANLAKELTLFRVKFNPNLLAVFKTSGNQELLINLIDFSKKVSGEARDIRTEYNGSLTGNWKTFLHEGICFRFKIIATEEIIPQKRDFFKVSNDRVDLMKKYEEMNFELISKETDAMWNVLFKDGKEWIALSNEVFEESYQVKKTHEILELIPEAEEISLEKEKDTAVGIIESIRANSSKGKCKFPTENLFLINLFRKKGYRFDFTEKEIIWDINVTNDQS